MLLDFDAKLFFKIPSDVDVRIMLTFLELFQTLLGFVFFKFFKLYTDMSLVYPPPLDVNKDEDSAGIGAYVLKEIVGADVPVTAQAAANPVESAVSGKLVRHTIKAVTTYQYCGQLGTSISGACHPK